MRTATDRRRFAGDRGGVFRRGETIVDETREYGTWADWLEVPRHTFSAFFARGIEEAGCAAGSVLYVGDRLDNDIRPTQDVGMATALIRRGPWGFIVEDETVTRRCLFRLTGLAELPGLIREHNTNQG